MNLVTIVHPRTGAPMTVEGPLLTVGVLMPLKKARKHWLDLTHPQFLFVLLHPDHLTAQQLHTLGIHLVIHKISDLLLEPQALAAVHGELQAWGGLVVDEVDRVQVLGDRWETCCQLLQLSQDVTIGTPFRLPPTGLLQDTGTSLVDLRFPLIRKPIVACSQVDSHSMCLFHSADQLTAPTDAPQYILQEYIPHHGLLYKVYVIGEAVRMQLRPSLQVASNGCSAASTPLYFDSQSMKHKELIPQGSSRHQAGMARIESLRGEVERFSRILQDHLQLTLFGWDLIVDERDGTPYIIDVNYFPGFDEVAFMPLFTQALLSKFSTAQEDERPPHLAMN